MNNQEIQLTTSFSTPELLNREYFDKFKQGLNLCDQSESKLSIIEKTNDDQQNNTYFVILNMQERLNDQIQKNNQLESTINQLQQQLQTSIQHCGLLQLQIDKQSKIIQDISQLLQKNIQNFELEKLFKYQLFQKNTEYYNAIKSQEQLFYQLLHIVDPMKQIKINLESYKKHLNASLNSTKKRIEFTKQIGTDDTTIKDSSCSEQKSQENARFSESTQQFYYSTNRKRGSNLFSPNLQQSPSNINLEKQIENTIARVKAIKLQFQQFK